jgi:hypothetical protein
MVAGFEVALVGDRIASVAEADIPELENLGLPLASYI